MLNFPKTQCPADQLINIAYQCQRIKIQPELSLKLLFYEGVKETRAICNAYLESFLKNKN